MVSFLHFLFASYTTYTSPCSSSFNPLCNTFYRTKVFNLDEVEFINFFLWITLLVSSLKKTLCLALDPKTFLYFFFLKVFYFAFKSVIELIFI